MGEYAKIVSDLYKNDEGEKLKISPLQEELFGIIATKKYPNNQVMTFTRWGKSLTSALAVLTRATTFPEKWIIAAPTTRKARIIMSYISQHIADNEYTARKFLIDREEIDAAKMRRERSKQKLTFNVMEGKVGEILVISTEETKKHKDPLDAMMGFGAPNIILDESSLISDQKYVGILRMLGDSPNPFICEIGNPFRRNHFFDTYKDPKYHHFFVDCKKGLKDGRITQEQIERMKNKAFFDVLYQCKFPSADEMDIGGWTPLFPDELLDEARSRHIQARGTKIMGVDVAEGGDENVWVIRTSNYAWIKAKDRNPDLMQTARKTRILIEEEGISPNNVKIDAIGDGAGVVSRILEQGIPVDGVNVGARAIEHDRYLNTRAENYMKVRDWLREGGALEYRDEWDELTDIKYKTNERGVIQIISKEKLRSSGIPSPNIADAIMLTFTGITGIMEGEGYDEENYQPRYKDRRGY